MLILTNIEEFFEENSYSGHQTKLSPKMTLESCMLIHIRTVAGIHIIPVWGYFIKEVHAKPM